MTENKECKVCECACKTKEFLERDHSALEKVAIVSGTLLTGFVIGYLMWPMKKKHRNK